MQKKSIGLVSATFLGIASIIGSGWLFAPYNCAVVAGPGSIFCWIVGAIVICLLAMCFAEIAVLYPKRGLSAIIPTISHNKFFGFPFAIANWLGIIAVVALEAVATIQYLTWLIPSIQHYFYDHGQLTLFGICLSILLVCGYCMVNYYGTKVLTKTNNPLSLLKITIPIITAVVIIGVIFHPQNFTLVADTIIPHGYKSIFSAILTAGIIIAFNGFQTVVSFSSEIKNPKKTIPLSMLLAIVICSGVYLLLQIAFIGGLPSELLIQGWKNLGFSAPMVQLVGLIGVGSLAPLIYFGATIGPSGAAIAFTGSATNMSTAMANNHQLPEYFGVISPLCGISRRSLLLNTGLAIMFIFLFRSWSDLAQVLSLFHLISYLPIPIALCVFRDAVEHEKYSFFLPWGRVVAALLFVFFTYLFAIGSSLETATDLMLMLAVFQIIFIALNVKSIRELFGAIKQCCWLLLYFSALLIFIWISPSNKYLLDEWLFNVLVVCFGVVFFFILSKTETGDVEIMDAAVNIYKRH